VDQQLLVLCTAAVTIALVHTPCGPDHYIPFVAMSRAAGWSLRKTMTVTLISGLGHVGSSVLIGFIGVALGEALSRLEFVEQTRGRAAGWMLIVFGFAYFVWGIFYSLRDRRHGHCHVHGHRDHTHDEVSQEQVHDLKPVRLTPWILFTIFIFGPCEPLIPLLMYPAAQDSVQGVLLVSFLFSFTTIATMLLVVLCLVQGTRVIRFPALHAYTHAMAGIVVMLCGVAINFGL